MSLLGQALYTSSEPESILQTELAVTALLLYLVLSDKDWAPSTSTLQAHTPAVGQEALTELPSLSSSILKEKPFLAPNLLSFNHGCHHES